MKQTLIALPLVATFLPLVLGAPNLQRRAAVCGSKGWDDGTDGYAYVSKGSYAACSTACQNDPVHCKSFSYDGNGCNLYNVAVTGNFEKDSDSPFMFYDASCLTTSSSTSSSSTTSKSSTTTAKTSTSTTSNKSSTSASMTTSTTTSIAVSTSTTKSTTKIATTTTASTTSISTSASTSTPPCPLPTWTLHDFTFINSTHNLDCAGSDGSSSLCYTGLPTQPQGYGPPDSVSVTIDGIGACRQQNPGSVPLRSIGDDVVRCGGSQKQLSFYGDSNSASSVASFDIQNTISCGSGVVYTAYASVKAQMDCVYDAGRNATCTLRAGSIVVPATSFGNIIS